MKKVILSLIALTFIIWSCSKDRSILLPVQVAEVIPTPTPTPPEKTIKDYTFDATNTQKVFDKLASKSEKKTIKSASDLPFIAKNGTKIWIEAQDLYLLDGSKATYPFDLEVLELLTPQDMILHQKPTVSYGQLLTTGGELFIKATKNNQELSTRFYNNISIIMPSQYVVPGMYVFDGSVTNTGFVEWQIQKESPRQGVPSGVIAQDSGRTKSYVIFPSQIGWINCDKFYNYTGPKTKITFNSTYPEMKNIQTFIFFPNIKSVMGVYDGVSGDVPVGQLVKIISVAVTKDEKIFWFTKSLTITPNEVVDIQLVPTTEQEIQSYLQSLTF